MSKTDQTYSCFIGLKSNTELNIHICFHLTKKPHILINNFHIYHFKDTSCILCELKRPIEDPYERKCFKYSSLKIFSYLARHNLFIDLYWLVSKKWRVASSHLIDKNSKCPPVNSFIVALKKTKEIRKESQFLLFSLHLGKLNSRSTKEKLDFFIYLIQ